MSRDIVGAEASTVPGRCRDYHSNDGTHRNGKRDIAERMNWL